MATVAQLAYELSLRALDQQETSLRELRARTGTLLAASSLTASFLGAPALQGGLSVPAGLALVAFAATMASCLMVLVPRAQLRFAMDGVQAYEALHAVGSEDAHVHLTRWIARSRVRNHAVLTRLRRRFERAAVALVAQTLLLALGLVVP